MIKRVLLGILLICVQLISLGFLVFLVHKDCSWTNSCNKLFVAPVFYILGDILILVSLKTVNPKIKKTLLISGLLIGTVVGFVIGLAI